MSSLPDDKITKELASSLRGDIEAALKSVGIKHGVVFNTGNATYTTSDICYKLNVLPVQADGSIGPDRKQKQVADSLSIYGRMDGIPENRLAGTPFTFKSGKRVKLIGYLARGQMPYLAEEISSKVQYILAKEAILQGIDS